MGVEERANNLNPHCSLGNSLEPPVTCFDVGDLDKERGKRPALVALLTSKLANCYVVCTIYYVSVADSSRI